MAFAHAALIALLVTIVPTEPLIELARPLAVRLIELAPEVPAPPKPEPPKSLPRPKVPLPPPPILAVKTPAPAAEPVEFAVPPQPPAPSPSASAAPGDIAPDIAPAAPPVPATPPPVTQARFDADYLNNPKPIYPSSSRRLGEEGKVILRVQVTPEGLPAVVEIKTSSGFTRLDHAAREAVLQWRFVPARRGEEPITSWVLVPIVFSLES